MQRIIGLLINQFMRLYTHHDIRRLYADHQVIIAKIFNPLYLSQCTLHQPFRRHPSIFFQNLFLQRSAVYSHTNRNMKRLCCIHHSLNPVSRADIARVNPNLICAVFHRGNRHLIIKVNIRHQRNRYLFLNLPHSQGCFFCRHRHPDDLTASFLQTVNLCNRSLNILGVCIAH